MSYSCGIRAGFPAFGEGFTRVAFPHSFIGPAVSQNKRRLLFVGSPELFALGMCENVMSRLKVRLCFIKRLG